MTLKPPKAINRLIRQGKTADCFNAVSQLPDDSRPTIALIATQKILERKRFSEAVEFAKGLGVPYHRIPIVVYALRFNRFDIAEEAVARDPRQIDTRPIGVRSFHALDSPLAQSLANLSNPADKVSLKRIDFCYAHGANACLVNETTGLSPLNSTIKKYGAQHFDIVMRLLDYDPQALAIPDKSGLMPLNHSIKKITGLNSYGADLTRALLDRGALEYMTDLQREGATLKDPLFNCALREGSQAVIIACELLKRGWPVAETTYQTMREQYRHTEIAHARHPIRTKAKADYDRMSAHLGILEIGRELERANEVVIDISLLSERLEQLRDEIPAEAWDMLDGMVSDCAADLISDYDSDEDYQLMRTFVA